MVRQPHQGKNLMPALQLQRHIKAGPRPLPLCVHSIQERETLIPSYWDMHLNCYLIHQFSLHSDCSFWYLEVSLYFELMYV